MKKIIKLRHELHANPEVSGEEKNTSKRITRFLKTCNPDEIRTKIGGFGIIAIWDSKAKGKTILFRAELDALPITEVNTVSYKSAHPGKSHACGHDGHSAILCALAKYLSKNPPLKGKVGLIFQPAEENGTGAAKMLKESIIQEADFIFALHNLPGFPLNEVLIKDLHFTASVNSIILKLQGKTAHAAEPENGINPAVAVAQIIQNCHSLINADTESAEMAIITPVHINLGQAAYGVSAGDAEIHLTLRAWSDSFLRELEASIIKLTEEIAKAQQLQFSYDFIQTFKANVNDPDATNICRIAAADAGLSITELRAPFKWGEDFGQFTKQIKGCMIGLGAGVDTPALHNPDYDFPDELLNSGVNIWTGVLNHFMQGNEV